MSFRSKPDWVERPLEECMNAIIDYRGKTPIKTSQGIPLVTAKVVKNGRIETPDEFIAPENYDSWMSRGLPRSGDVVLTTEAPLGEVAQLDGAKVALAQRIITLRGSNDILDNGFLRYLMQGAHVQEQLRARASGTTVIGIRQSELRKIILRFPPLSQQRAIAHILGTLDDKIELNRRTNETLESMARALFKSWFVDFNPVRAKSEGRPPTGLDPETAALFPSEFVDSEHGLIPKGWHVVSFLEFAALLSGGTPKTSAEEFWNGSIKWASAKDISQCGSFFLTDTERTITDQGLARSATKIVPAGAVAVVARGATCGRFTVFGEPMAMNQTCYALVARNSSARWHLRFSAEGLLARLVTQAHGSVFDTITTSTFQRATILAPTTHILQRFEERATQILELIRGLENENRTITCLRDDLLPHLLSGELSVASGVGALQDLA